VGKGGKPMSLSAAKDQFSRTNVTSVEGNYPIQYSRCRDVHTWGRTLPSAPRAKHRTPATKRGDALSRTSIRASLRKNSWRWIFEGARLQPCRKSLITMQDEANGRTLSRLQSPIPSFFRNLFSRAVSL
jgi:hypothetical protein